MSTIAKKKPGIFFKAELLTPTSGQFRLLFAGRMNLLLQKHKVRLRGLDG
jgi:hypothetical protein